MAAAFALVLVVASMSQAAVVPVFVPLILNLPDQPEVAPSNNVVDYGQADDYLETNDLETKNEPLYYDYGLSM